MLLLGCIPLLDSVVGGEYAYKIVKSWEGHWGKFELFLNSENESHTGNLAYFTVFHPGHAIRPPPGHSVVWEEVLDLKWDTSMPHSCLLPGELPTSLSLVPETLYCFVLIPFLVSSVHQFF